MICRSVQEEILSRSGGGPLRLAAPAAEHAAGCPECSRRMEEVQAMDALLAALPEPGPSPFLWTRIEAGLQQGWRPVRGSLWRPAPAWLAAAALLLLSAAVSGWEGPAAAPPAELPFAEAVLGEPVSDRVNPFLSAQIGSVNGSNPFLRAMLAEGENPFAVRLRQR